MERHVCAVSAFHSQSYFHFLTSQNGPISAPSFVMIWFVLTFLYYFNVGSWTMLLMCTHFLVTVTLSCFPVTGIHTCFECKRKSDEMVKCSMLSCGRYYHAECLSQLGVSGCKDSNRVICSQHNCATCAADVRPTTKSAAKTSKGSVLILIFTARPHCLQCRALYTYSNSVYPFVRLSVRPSVTRWYPIQTNEHRITRSSL